MTPTRSAAEIAATLTKAQRRALLWLPQDGKQKHWYLRDQGGFRPHTEGLSLEHLRLAVSNFDASWWRLTPLGAEVRAILASTEHGNADG